MADQVAGIRAAVDMSAGAIAARLEELRALYRLAQSLATARRASDKNAEDFTGRREDGKLTGE